jgi:hypothetical protein
MHQTADKAPGFGVESTHLDRDRWLLGDETGLHHFVGVSPPPKLEDRVDAIESFLKEKHGFEPLGSE